MVCERKRKTGKGEELATWSNMFRGPSSAVQYCKNCFPLPSSSCLVCKSHINHSKNEEKRGDRICNGKSQTHSLVEESRGKIYFGLVCERFDDKTTGESRCREKWFAYKFYKIAFTSSGAVRIFDFFSLYLVCRNRGECCFLSVLF